MQVCNSTSERKHADTILERYVTETVMSIVTTFFSSPFSDQSTSLQVCTGGYMAAFKAQSKWDPRAESRFYPLALWFCQLTTSEGLSQLSVRLRRKTRESFLETKG